MSVLIRGMEMPKSCHVCRFYEGDIYYCSADDKRIDILDSSEGKCQFCPLDTVVHCKDCKYCEHTLKRPNAWKPNETCEEHYNCMRIENGIKPIVFPDSFCSFGEHGDMRVTL